MNFPSSHIAHFQRPTVLDSWSPAPVRVKREQDQGGIGNNNNYNKKNSSMLLNRWRELGQERIGDPNTDPSSSRIATIHAPASHLAGNDGDMDIIDSNGDDVPSENPRLCVNKANGHISVVPGSASTQPRHPIANGESVNGASSSRLHASGVLDLSSQSMLPSPVVTEQGEEAEEREDLPLVFLGVVFGVIPSQWYSKSLAKWCSGVEALGGRFIAPPTESVPDLVLLPLSDERSNLATPVEADVPEHWKCPIAVTSWITQCVMAGKLFELHNPDVPILGLDPLAVRVLERRKGRPIPTEQQLSVAGASGSASNASMLQGLSAQIARMGESVASQNAAVSAFADGQGTLHSQVRQLASAINNLTEQLHRSHQATSQRIDHLAGLLHNKSQRSRSRDFHESSSRIYAAVTDEARRVSAFNRRRNSFVPTMPDRIGAEQRQTQQATSGSSMPVTFTPPANGVGSRTSASFSRAGPLPSPPDNDNVISLPNTSAIDHHPSPSQRLRLVFRSSTDGVTHHTTMARSSGTGSDGNRDASRTDKIPSPYLGTSGSPPVSHPVANSRDTAGAVAAAQLGPLASISPSELQSLLRNVFSETPQKDHEVFWHRARSIYIEHLGERAPRRVSITHVSEAQAVFPKRYLYDKIIFVSTVPGEDALAILFDMKEKEVVIYDTVDRYRNNLFTFGKEKTLAESFGLKDAAWYVVELVAETEKEDSFPLVCLATKIFASRDRKSFRDLFPPHVVVAKKNIKNPIPPRRQAKADYYWRLVRPRVVQHLVKELSAVLLTRYRHEDTQWVDVPKCSEWVEGLTRFEDSEEAKELPDGRFKGEDGNRPVSSGKKERGLSVAPTDAPAVQQRPAEEYEITEPQERPHQTAEGRAHDTAPAPTERLTHSEHFHSTPPTDQPGSSDSERQQQKRPAEGEPVEYLASKKQRSEDIAENMPSAHSEHSQRAPSLADSQ